jgi:hypothetical protein
VGHVVVGRYYDPATGQFLSVDPMVDETLEAYVYAGDDPVDSTDPIGNVTECKAWKYQYEPMPTSCGIWPDDYQILTRQLGVHLTSPKLDKDGSLRIYGPVVDFINQKGASVKNLSIALHLIQDDLYHYMDYDTWLDNWGGALSVFQAYCGLGSQCWPTGDLNAGQRVDSTILWLEQRYQQKGLPRWSEGAIETVETCGELVEWLGDIGAGICVGVAGVGAA